MESESDASDKLLKNSTDMTKLKNFITLIYIVILFFVECKFTTYISDIQIFLTNFLKIIFSGIENLTKIWSIKSNCYICKLMYFVYFFLHFAYVKLISLSDENK